MNDNATDKLTDNPRLAEGDKLPDNYPGCEAAQNRIEDLEALGEELAGAATAVLVMARGSRARLKEARNEWHRFRAQTLEMNEE